MGIGENRIARKSAGTCCARLPSSSCSLSKGHRLADFIRSILLALERPAPREDVRDLLLPVEEELL